MLETTPEINLPVTSFQENKKFCNRERTLSPIFLFVSVNPESCPPFMSDNASLFIGKNAVDTPLVQGISLWNPLTHLLSADKPMPLAQNIK